MHNGIDGGTYDYQARGWKRKCPTCNEPYVAMRYDMRHCSNKCRQKAYRQRKKETEAKPNRSHKKAKAKLKRKRRARS